MLINPRLSRRLLTSSRERREHSVFRDLLKQIPGFEKRLMESSDDEVVMIADMVCFHSYLNLDITVTSIGFRSRRELAALGLMTPKESSPLSSIGSHLKDKPSNLLCIET
jgi:hypothetical protein